MKRNEKKNQMFVCVVTCPSMQKNVQSLFSQWQCRLLQFVTFVMQNGIYRQEHRVTGSVKHNLKLLVSKRASVNKGLTHKGTKSYARVFINKKMNDGQRR